MTLTIDIGNTRVKWVLYKGALEQAVGAFCYTLDTFSLDVAGAKMPFKGAVVLISNVSGNGIKSLLKEVLDASGCEKYSYAQTKQNQCGVVNSYADFSQLGIDRWLAMIAGFNHKVRLPGEAVCVIDCGTAVTLDVVDSKGCHLGGLIAPGLAMMQSMLMRETGNIDPFNVSKGVSNMCLERATGAAVSQGCAQLLVGGLDEMISRYSGEQEQNMICLVTGGDGAWVAKSLAADNVYEPLLVNKGLWHVSGKCESSS